MAGALDVIEVVIEMFILGQRVLNVYHMISSDSVPDGDVEDDLSAYFADLYSPLASIQANDLTYNSITMKNITEGEDIGDFAWLGTAAGASSTDPLPTGIAGLLTLPTDILGTRGRKFFPGITEGATTDGVFVGTLLTVLAGIGSSLLAGFLGEVSDSPWTYVVIDKNGVPRAPVGADVSNVPAYQRRRKVGVGE